jgi:hypothetical protein
MVDCIHCNGTGIDPAKRAELEELMGLAPNPHAKEPTGERCPQGINGKHELYASPSGYYCRACGYRETPTDA